MKKDNKLLPKQHRHRIIRKMLKIFGLFLLALIVFWAIRLLLLRRSIGIYSNYWQTRSVEKAPENAITYVALGDSAAQGIGASKPEKGYVGLIADSLATRTGKPVHVTNLSVTGAKVQDTIDSQLPALKKLALKDDAVITLDIGANNIRTYSHDAFAAQIDELFRQLPKQTVVSDMPYFGGGRANSGEKAAVDASETILKVASKYGLKFAPLHQVTKDNDGFTIYAADCFHPNDRGYRNWYKAFWTALKG